MEYHYDCSSLHVLLSNITFLILAVNFESVRVRICLFTSSLYGMMIVILYS